MASRTARIQEQAGRPRKKRRRKRAPETTSPDVRAPLDAQGRERPPFVLAFPHDPELERLIAAFEAGNYALVRSEANRVAEQTDDPQVRDAALELRRRIEPDPLLKYLLLVSVALLAFLVLYAYVLHEPH